tara:strand:+ start:47579 stop:48610 length:1032 start_codon:yes stop_codon:yes gene_type:complete
MKNTTTKSLSIWLSQLALVFTLVFTFVGCSDDAQPDTWQLVSEGQSGALLSVWGTSSTDVWTVGADARDGTGPLVLHYDGSAWQRIETGETEGNLWWVHGFDQGPIFMGGDGGVILRYDNGVFTKMTTPDVGTVFGMWGASPDAMWAVGSLTPTSGGFAWRLDGDTWTVEPGIPAAVTADAALWKVNGRSADDLYLVGSSGVALHWNGTAISTVDTGTATSLFTVHCSSDRVVAVGGLATGSIVEYDGTSWQTTTPENAPGLTGVFIGPDDEGIAVGQYGAVYERTGGNWRPANMGFTLDQGFHATWIDPDGGVWAVGGQTYATPMTDGMILHRGAEVATTGL